MPAGSDAAL